MRHATVRTVRNGSTQLLLLLLLLHALRRAKWVALFTVPAKQ
jgi:hypothetical protein